LGVLGLSRLLGEGLEEFEDWSAGYWIDDIAPTSDEILSPTEIRVEGRMNWSAGDKSS
jgi:hypothetical protein